MFPRRTICQIAQFLFLGKKMNQWRKKFQVVFQLQHQTEKHLPIFKGPFNFFPLWRHTWGFCCRCCCWLAAALHMVHHIPPYSSLCGFYIYLSLPFSFSLSLSRSFHLSMQLISFSSNVLVFNHAVGNCFPVQLSAVCLADLCFL